MKIDDCYLCGEPVKEGTKWQVDIYEGFSCEKCNSKKEIANEEYHANAAWLKSLKNEGSK